MRFLDPLAAAFVLSALAPCADAQADRYEIGLRLRAFERRLDATTDATRRSAAFAELDRAVQAFFRMNMNGVAAAVAAADAALQETPRSEATRWAERLWVRLPQRLCDLETGKAPIDVQFLRFGREDDSPEQPDGAEIVFRLGESKDDVLRAPLASLPLPLELPLGIVGEGDHALSWRVEVRGNAVIAREQSLSVVDKRDARIAALEAATADDATIEGATLQSLRKTLRGMTKARSEETMLPGARLLREAEELAAASATDAKAPCYTKARAGQSWLRVPTARGDVALRIATPAAAAQQQTTTLVVALHGAGGSENLFFDGYGDGAIARLCEARGWILCAPRSSGFTGVDVPALLDALQGRYAIDRSRVLLIGHSMGAMQAVAQASASPTSFRAVAALGGGGGPRKSDPLTKVPFFVAAGERDFGRAGASRLAEQLRGFGVDADYHEYPDVEHLAIVQVALPDVFAFFDKSLQGSADAK
jgi:predicted esterase